MNLSQKQSILNSIESILAFDFDQLINENNPSGNIEEIQFGDYTVLEFKNNYVKVFKQLKSELESGLGLMLPNQETFNNEFASVTLDIETANFNTYLQSFSTRNDAAEILKRFIYYQIRQGFWNKSAVKQHNVDAEKLNQAQENLNLIQKNLSENLESFESLKASFNKQIEDFQLILDEKTSQSEKITGYLVAAELDSASVNNFLLASTTKDTEISGLVATIKNKLSSIETDIIDYKESFEEIKLQDKILNDQLKKDLEASAINLTNSKEGNKYINDQKDTITKLIGMAADGSLGYKFDSRKSELQNGIKSFWRWAVPVSIAVALGWVVTVFTFLNAHLSNEWINLLVNVIKTTPAWILVGFVFSQYGKERNLQEEYAFKSAIAMTLTSYSQMLSENDASDKKAKSSKQEMLLKSIENLYTQPILKHEKRDSGNLLNSKELVDSLKSIAEMVKNIKS